MLTSSEIIKSFWLKYKGDVDAVLKAIKDKEEVPEEFRKTIARFDSRYDSIVVVDEEYSKLNPRFAHLSGPGVAAMLIRWNRKASFRDRLLNSYDKTVFILDDDIESYVLPAGLMAIGLHVEKDGFHLISEQGAELLVTSNFNEVVWFISAACHYLVVGSKGIGIGADKIALSLDQRTTIFEAYAARMAKDEPDDCVMIVPGKPGCFSNRCLKLKDYYPNTRFVDCWDDIIKIIDHKIPYK